MTVTKTNLPTEVLDALVERGHHLEAIVCMSPEKAFMEYCDWHGLCGWGETLWRHVHEMSNDLKEKVER